MSEIYNFMKLINGYRGLIWEVPLGEELGYAYVRFTDLDDHFGNFVRILNYRSVTKLKYFDAEKFSSYDELVAPFLALGRPVQRGEKRWRAVGYIPMRESDYHLPDFKGTHPWTFKPEKQLWYIIRGVTPGDCLRDESRELIEFTYTQVKHLSIYDGHQNLRYSTCRIILEWMKVLNMDYMTYVDPDMPIDFLERQKYCVLVSMPYSEVPIEIRGRVIEQRPDVV